MQIVSNDACRIKDCTMDRVGLFYSQPSRMSLYPMYEKTKSKQRGGIDKEAARSALLTGVGVLGSLALRGLANRSKAHTKRFR